MKKKKPAPGKMAVVRAMVFAKDSEEKAATLRMQLVRQRKGELEAVNALLETELAGRLNAQESLRENEALLRDVINKIMVDRELRIIELKKQVNELRVKAGLPAHYKTDFEDEVDGVPDQGKQV